MQNSESLDFEIPLGLSLREIKTALVGWGIYMIALFFYCVLYHIFVFNTSAHIPESFIRVMREWGIWLLITPVAFKLLRQFERLPEKRILPCLVMGAGILLLAVSFRVAIDYLTDARSIAASIVIIFPRYLAALAVVVMIWHIFLRNNPPTTSLPPAIGENNKPRNHYPSTILVNKGNDECLIRVDQIQCISAAGNYVEIYCNDQLYLIRATMKQIMELLPPSLFLRTHRSHIININEIDRIKNRPSGNGAVQLRCGKLLTVSKKYKSQLRKYRLHAA
ncbi:MAG: LytTR family transcriptional regulator [Gammaproteobacteria bacterium]|nr:LytTR family transcriptional regulator [Gammaproteobacteria bacterium]